MNYCFENGDELEIPFIYKLRHNGKDCHRLQNELDKMDNDKEKKKKLFETANCKLYICIKSDIIKHPNCAKIVQMLFFSLTYILRNSLIFS